AYSQNSTGVEISWCGAKNKEAIRGELCFEEPIKVLVHGQYAEVVSFDVAFSYNNSYFIKSVTGNMLPEAVIKRISECPQDTKIFLDKIVLKTDDSQTYNLEVVKGF